VDEGRPSSELARGWISLRIVIIEMKFILLFIFCSSFRLQFFCLNGKTSNDAILVDHDECRKILEKQS